MKARDKAEELVNKYVINMPIPFHIEDAKICALIAVNYIINSNPHSNPFNTNVESTMSYWQEVKEEISKL
jgi:hypothetical protein